MTYSEVARLDGVTIGAASIRVAPGPRRTFSAHVGAVKTEAGSVASIPGPWKVDLVQQLTDQLTPGRLQGAFGYRDLPFETPAGKVSFVYLGGGFVTVTVDAPSGPQTIHLVGFDDGHVRVVSKEEFGRLQPQSPKPFVFGTPLPGASLRK
jgi:hypothetical protein